MRPVPHKRPDAHLDPAPAPETAEQRQARHLADITELQQLAMHLARKAAIRADAQLDEIKADPAEPQPAANAETARPARPIDYPLAFARLSRVAKRAIALEMRIHDGPALRFRTRSPVTTPATTPANDSGPALAGGLARPQADPRRLLLRQALHRSVQSDPDRARRRREIDRGIDDLLATDPARQTEIGTILDTLCRDLDLTLDLAQLPDILLGTIPNLSAPDLDVPDLSAPDFTEPAPVRPTPPVRPPPPD